MLIRLVSAVLQRFLGQYVENLDTERLSYSLGYQGNVVLTDLRLNTEALRHLLGLPVRLRSGHIGRVQLHIPLTQLRTQPWCITVEDTELVVCPEDLDEWEGGGSEFSRSSSQDDSEAVKAHRKAYLDRLEARWWQVVQEGGLVGATAATASPTDSSWWSYGVSLAYGIVSNLQVEIRNVHFSFRDENRVITGIGEPQFAWGIRFDQLTAQATDEKWVMYLFAFLILSSRTPLVDPLIN